MARLFEVTETTIKRWADSGDLTCDRTPGGHRKFLLSDVLAFAGKHGYHAPGLPRELDQHSVDEATKAAILGHDLLSMKEMLVSRALSRDPGKVGELLVSLSHSNVPLEDLCDEVIDEGMETIGDLWLSGEAGIETEHRASYEITDAISRIEAGLHAAQPNGMTALLACPSGEHHEIALRGIAGLLRLKGWKVIYLGADIPGESIAAAIHKQSPDLVCLSLTQKAPIKTRSNELTGIYRAVQEQNGKLVLGGSGVNRRFADALLCDRVCESMHELQRYLRQAFPEKKEPVHS